MISPTPALSTRRPVNADVPEKDAIGVVPRVLLTSKVASGVPVNPIPILLVPVGENRILPVVSPPIVKVLLSSDWILELAALNTSPLLLVVAERVATGVPVATPVIANCAEAVDVPPTAKSKVEFDGDNRLFVSCQ